MRKSITILWISGLLATCSRPETSEAGTGLQIFAGAAKWNEELGKLKNPRGVLPNGTNTSAPGVIFRDPATSYEFFAYDDNVVLLLMSNSPVYFIKMETKDFQYHLKNELDQLRAGTYGPNKTFNSTTYFKELGDYQVEVFFSPTEIQFTQGSGKIKDKNDPTYVDLWRLYEAANNVVFYTPSFDEQIIANDFYTQYQAGNRRVILADASSITNPINYNLKSYGLNFSFMFGNNLSVTGNLLGCADLNNCSDKYFADPYWTTADFAAFFSLPIGNSADSSKDYLSSQSGHAGKDGIVVIIRGNIQKFQDFITAQGVNLNETPVTPVYVPPAKLMLTEVSPSITGSFDLIELKVLTAGSLLGIRVDGRAGSNVNFITFPDVQVAAGDLIVVHCNGATETGFAPGNETTAKNQYSVGTYTANFDNAWDFQGTANGITNTDTLVLVCTGTCSSGTIQDAVALTSQSGTSSGGFKTNLTSVQSWGAWLPADCGGVPCTDATTPTAQGISSSMASTGTTRTGISVQRRNTGSYLDTNQASDWSQVTATFGTDTVVTDGVAPTPGGGGAIIANAVSFSQIDLSWTAGTDNITAQGSLTYDICQSTSSTGCNTFSATYSNGAGVVTKSVTGLTANTTYYFVVRVVDGSSNSATYTQTSATTPVNSDSTAPSPVSTLAIGTVTATSIQLNWTAVGDDGNTGTATSYEMRYLSGASCPLTSGNFATGTLVSGMPAPQVATSAETKTVTGLTASTSYCFALKVSDEVPNQSGISNVVTQTTSTPVQPTLKNATAVNATTVDLNFSAAMSAASIDGLTGRFTFNNGLSATAVTLQTGAPNANQRVRVTTSAQVAGTIYLATVAGTVTDSIGTAMDTGNNTASFNGFSGTFGIMDLNTAGMEGANATYWTNGGGTLSNSTLQSHSGTNSVIWSTLLSNATCTCSSGRTAKSINYYPVTPGGAYTASVWMKSGTVAGTSVQGRLCMYWFKDSSGTVSATANSNDPTAATVISTSGSPWTAHSGAFTAPSDAYFMKYEIHGCYTGTSSDQLYFDEAYFGP